MENPSRILSRRTLIKTAAILGALSSPLVAACGSAPSPTPAPAAPAGTPKPAAAVEPTKPVPPTATTAPTPAAPTATSPPAAAPAAKSAGPTTIEFWHPRSGQTGEVLAKYAKMYSDANPGTTLKLVLTPNESAAGANPKFLAAALGGNPPDIFMHDGSSFSTSVALNAFAQLDDMAKRDAINRDSFFDFAWAKVQYAGKTWGLPFDTDARLFYYNKKLLAGAGYDKPPGTIDELDAYAEKLTKKQGTKFDQLGFIPWFGNWYPVGWAWLWGAQVYDEKNNKMMMDAQEWVDSLEWKVGYAKKYGIQEMTTFQQGFQGAANNPFYLGKVAMMPTGNWVIANIKQYAPQLEFDIAPVPAPTGKKTTTWAGGFVFGIPTGSKQRDESWKVVKYYTGGETEFKIVDEYANLPTNKAAADLMAKKADPRIKKFLDVLPIAHTEPVIPEWSLAWDESIAADQEALFGRKSAKQALSDANAKVQKEIDKRLKEQ